MLATSLKRSALAMVSAELNRAQQHLSEWSAISGVASTEAQGFIAEAQARIGRDKKIDANQGRGVPEIDGNVKKSFLE